MSTMIAVENQRTRTFANTATADTSDTLTETGRLVVAAQRGDRDAFAELCVMYQQRVYSIAMRRLGNDAEAQELAQEVFIKAMCKIDQVREPNCFSGWLRSITTRMALNRLTRRRPDFATAPEMLVDACVDTVTPLDHALDVERRMWLRAGLDRLGQLDRDTLRAFYFDGQSILQMSDRFGSPVGTIKRRLHVARKRLAAVLTETESVDTVADNADSADADSVETNSYDDAPVAGGQYEFETAAVAELVAV
jgi:RNA polymerase sigma-70 factor (ECF subfamily)